MSASFVVPADHPCLPGHFPGHPVVPGVVILDHVQSAIESRQGVVGPLRLPRVKFLRPLLPGQRAVIVLEGGGDQAWRFRVERDGEAIATGEFVPA